MSLYHSYRLYSIFAVLFLVYCLHVQLVASSPIGDLKFLLTKKKIVPQIIQKAPEQVLKIQFGFTTDEPPKPFYLRTGLLLTNDRWDITPIVHYETPDSEALYTIIAVDPHMSGPLRAATAAYEQYLGKQFLIWLWTNIKIKNNTLTEGTLIKPYTLRNRLFNEVHRFFFVLYKQKIGQSIDSYGDILNFKIDQFVKRFDLHDPVAGNIFICDYGPLNLGQRDYGFKPLYMTALLCIFAFLIYVFIKIENCPKPQADRIRL